MSVGRAGAGLVLEGLWRKQRRELVVELELHQIGVATYGLAADEHLRNGGAAGDLLEPRSQLGVACCQNNFGLNTSTLQERQGSRRIPAKGAMVHHHWVAQDALCFGACWL